MNKDQLANELKQKLKLGIKPSDLKKPQLNTPASSPPASPIIEPIDKKFKQKSGPENILTSPIVQESQQIKQLQKDVNYWSQLSQTHLTNLQKATAELDQAEEQIKELQAQPNQLSQEIEQALKEANQKIRELEAKNKQLATKYSQLEKQAKITGETKPETKTFTCANCQQTKPQTELSRQFHNFSFCRACSQKARQQAQTNPQPFTCHTCQQPTNEIPTKMKLDKTLQAYSICSTCRPNLKEFNEADLITDELWQKYPYSSASEILEKEFNIQKEEKW